MKNLQFLVFAVLTVSILCAVSFTVGKFLVVIKYKINFRSKKVCLK